MSMVIDEPESKPQTDDDGLCNDCGREVFWSEFDGWYHHLDVDAAADGCFLIAPEVYPGADEVEAAGLDSTLRGLDGRPVGIPVTWAELRKAEAKRVFFERLQDWLFAGYKLVEAWDADGFNADQEFPLPSRIAPPMSLDEWFDELSEHYAQA